MPILGVFRVRGADLGDDGIPARFAATAGDIAAAGMRAMLEMVLGSRLVFEPGTRLDPDALRQATRRLLDVEPVLGSWYRPGLARADWVRCDDLDSCVPFVTVECLDPDRDAIEFHARGFETRDPRLAVALLRCTDHDEVCIRLCHLAGDGWSAKEVTHLLAETYTRVLCDPLYDPPPRTSPRPTHADVWAAMTPDQQAQAAESPKMGVSRWSARLPRGTGSGPAARSLTLSRERTDALRSYTHARGATVNDALVAAVMRSYASQYPQKPGLRPGVSITADTRRFARGADLDRVAVIATTQTVLADYVHGEPFEDTLGHVVQAVKPWKDALWGIGSPMNNPAHPVRPLTADLMFAVMTAVMRLGHAAALVTMNLGPFDEGRLAFGDLRPVSAVSTGVLGRFAGFPSTISYYREALTMWVGFRQDRVSAEVVERYLDGIESELEVAATATG
jgi:NRPS condensation-like uncharacterized protein